MSTSPDPAALFDQSPDALIFADREGVICAWNAAAERVFGFTREEAIGQSLDLIIPERFREAHWTGFKSAMGSGETKYAGQSLPTRAQSKTGAQVTVEMSFSVVTAGGAPVGALASARDITERFNEQRAQRQRIAELEQELADLRS